MSGEATVEFPFEIIVKYEDVSGRRKFETKVRLVYSAGEHGGALVDATAGRLPHREFKIINVVGMDVKRLS